MSARLRIAILGTRGIPARYGGFETFAEELSTRLAGRGHRVEVFCRKFIGSNTAQIEYKGVTLRYAWSIRHKYFETPIHALFSNLLLFGNKYDAALLCNAANSPLAWMIRLLNIPLAINVDGIERERSKWNWLGRVWYRIGERSSVLFASKVIGDAAVIKDYYRERYGYEAVMIPYGASAIHRSPGPILAAFNLTPNQYILYVSRLEPENNALGVIEAYVSLNTTVPLVIVGDAPYSESYKQTLRKAANERVIFTGYQFAEAYHELQSHCLLYIQATEVGGTHPALIEAMAYGNCVIANGTPENKEVLADAGYIYEKNNFQHLALCISEAMQNEIGRKQMKIKAKARANLIFDWEKITDQYEALFVSLSKTTSQESLHPPR